MSTGGIFTERVGGELIRYTGSGLPHDTDREPAQTTGWREGPDGSREKVQYYIGYGWYTEDELFEARQKDPRYAP